MATHYLKTFFRGEQIPGKENGQGDFRDFSWLERNRSQFHPQGGAIHGATNDGHQRHEEENDTGQHEQVAEAQEHAMISHDGEHQDKSHERDRSPRHLSNSGRLPSDDALSNIQPVNHGDAKAIDDRGDW